MVSTATESGKAITDIKVIPVLTFITLVCGCHRGQ